MSMRNSRIIYAIALCLVLSIAGIYAASQPIKLAGKLDVGGPRTPGSVDSFVLATFDDDSYQLEFEFLASAEDLTIEVWGDDGVLAMVGGVCLI